MIINLIIILFNFILITNLNSEEIKDNSNIYLQFSGGINFNRLYIKPEQLNTYTENSYNYNAGISIPIFNNKNQLLLNIGYILRKNKLYELEHTFAGVLENKENNHYLIFNANNKYQIINYENHSFYILGGTFLSYLINTENLLHSNYNLGGNPDYNNFDLGLNAGLGYEIKLKHYKFGLEYIFQQGLLNKLDEYDKYWNQSHIINLYFGVSLSD